MGFLYLHLPNSLNSKVDRRYEQNKLQTRQPNDALSLVYCQSSFQIETCNVWQPLIYMASSKDIPGALGPKSPITAI